MVKAGAPIHLLDPFAQAPMKDYCTNSNFYPIPKDPQRVTPQAPSQETEELENSFDFGNQVIEHILEIILFHLQLPESKILSKF